MEYQQLGLSAVDPPLSAAAKPSGASAPKAIASAAAHDSLEDRIRGGMTGGVADRLALSLLIGRALLARHQANDFHGGICTAAVLLDAGEHICFDERSAQPGGGACERDVRAYGYVLLELLSGELMYGSELPDPPPDLDPLLKAGYSEPLVAVVRRCTLAHDPQSDLRKAVSQLEKVVRDMVDQPRPTDEKGMIYWFGAIVFTIATILLFVFR
ncbi:MAG: hypothetical protein JNL98_36810 [Bryobacterales bacterium]|nr:hypothetical protein [Bryobacterales bacterium]